MSKSDNMLKQIFYYKEILKQNCFLIKFAANQTWLVKTQKLNGKEKNGIYIQFIYLYLSF